MNIRGNSLRTILTFAGFIVLVLLILDFNSRMADLRRLSAEKERVGAQVTSLIETQRSLETQIVYATSEAAVYKWAYESRRYARPEDNLVVPIQQGEATPVPAPLPTVEPVVVSNWQVWLALFLDDYSQ
jgi:hypothetical protein